MRFDRHGTRNINGKINSLADYLEVANDLQNWDYMGLKVEIDPTVDYNNNNVLVRWTDTLEGFNDRIIVKSIDEFNQHFTKIEL